MNQWPLPAAKIKTLSGKQCSCGSQSFVEGPKSGISINLCCADPQCRKWWNYTPVIGLFQSMNIIEPMPGASVKHLSSQEDKNLGEMRVWMDQGVQIYIRDGSPIECFVDRAKTSTYNPTTHDMLRFAGFIEALQSDMMIMRKAVDLEAEAPSVEEAESEHDWAP